MLGMLPCGCKAFSSNTEDMCDEHRRQFANGRYVGHPVYFQRKEFSCKCGCGFDSMDKDLLCKLNDLREYFNTPVHIESGNRCETHNRRVGGEPNSYHKRGRAVDIKVDGVSPDKVADYLEQKYQYCCGIGRYNSFTHFDNRTSKARWDYR